MEYTHELLAQEYDTMGTYKAVAQKYDISQKTVCEAVKKYGKPKGKGGNQTTAKISNDELAEAVKTMTRHEISDKYKINIDNLDRRMRKIQVHAVKTHQKREFTDTWHYVPNGEKFINEKTNGEFEFIAYMRKRYKIKCVKCGYISERAKSTIKEKNIICENCKNIEQEQKQLNEYRKKLARLLFSYAELQKVKVCQGCGNQFRSETPTKKYCSKKCKNGGNRHRKRAKKYGVIYEPGITLHKVYKKYNGICNICGIKTNWDDLSWGTSGATHPTIDHITALANGGSHTWENVQLACAYCNSCKRDLVNYRGA